MKIQEKNLQEIQEIKKKSEEIQFLIGAIEIQKSTLLKDFNQCKNSIQTLINESIEEFKNKNPEIFKDDKKCSINLSTGEVEFV